MLSEKELIERLNGYRIATADVAIGDGATARRIAADYAHAIAEEMKKGVVFDYVGDIIEYSDPEKQEDYYGFHVTAPEDRETYDEFGYSRCISFHQPLGLDGEPLDMLEYEERLARVTVTLEEEHGQDTA